jgi:hypothetical protein
MQVKRYRFNQILILYIYIGNALGEEATKRINGLLKVKSSLDFSKVDTSRSSVEILVPPGRIYHMYKDLETKRTIMEESEHDLFKEIIVSRTMYTDHLPLVYEDAFKQVQEGLAKGLGVIVGDKE